MKPPSQYLLGKIGIERLDSTPQVLLKLVDACNDPEAGFERLASIIQQDAALASKILNAANSPVYAQWGKIADFNRMLVVLGINAIKTIAITASVKQFFSPVQPQKDSYHRQFWRRSLRCACIARRLAVLTRYDYPEETYFAGLLHKLGQLVLLNGVSDAYIPLLESYHDSTRLGEAERKEFGIDHCGLGAWLVERWQKHGFIGDALRYQNEPPETILDAHPLIKLINVSSRLCEMQPGTAQTTAAVADTLFGLAPALLDEALETATREVEDAANALGIDMGDGEAIATDGPGNEDDRIDTERLELARVVRDVALIEGTSPSISQAGDLDATLAAVQQNLDILFGLSGAVFFLSDAQQVLRGYVLTKQNTALERLRITLDPGRSMISDALLKRQTCCSFEYGKTHTLNVIDRQLMRMANSGGILALPLVDKEHPLGVMIAGLEAPTWERLAPQLNLVQLFTREAALQIGHQQWETERLRQARSENQSMYHMHARKLIHEANNPLGVINNYLHILSTKLGEDHPAHDELNIIREELARVGKILLGLPQNLVESSHPPGVVDINRLIRDLDSILKSSLYSAHKIIARLDLDEQLPPVRSDEDQIKQILINLIKNAVEAMADGGTIQIGTLDYVVHNGQAYVEIRIGDNGPGIPPELLSGIFSPVVSTKRGGHAGLGLTIAANLVKKVSGTISCRSHSRGTEFQILLPRVLEEQLP